MWVLFVQVRLLDVKHGLDDVVRLSGKDLGADSTADKSNSFNGLSSELLVAWLLVLIEAAQEKIKSLSEMWVELGLNDDSS